MEAVLGILLALAAIAALFLGLQVGGARAASAKALREVEANRERLAELEADSKKSAGTADARRREIDELRERLKDAKRRRHEDQEASRLKKDLQEVREQVEREMEKKLAYAREEAESSKAAMKRLSAEVEALKARRPQPASNAVSAVVEEPSKAEAKAPEPNLPPAARPLKDEERARLESAEKGFAKSKARIDELEVEVKRLKGRTETDRRVFVVQKGELDLAKDRFRALESRYNERVLERDELAKQVWTLDKQMKALQPTAPDSGSKGNERSAENSSKGPESRAASEDTISAKA